MILGVDPGVRGGMAVLDSGGQVVCVQKFEPGMTEDDVVAHVIDAALHFDPARRVCFMERVGYIRGDGGQGAFTFGKIYGLLRGSIRMIGFKIHDVQPLMWQAALECVTGGNKNVSKRRAQALFPEEKVTHAIADALLIAEFGRRRLVGAA